MGMKNRFANLEMQHLACQWKFLEERDCSECTYSNIHLNQYYKLYYKFLRFESSLT